MMASGYSRYAYNQFEQIMLSRFATYELEGATQIHTDYATDPEDWERQEEENTLPVLKRRACPYCSFAVLRGFMY